MRIESIINIEDVFKYAIGCAEEIWLPYSGRLAGKNLDLWGLYEMTKILDQNYAV